MQRVIRGSHLAALVSVCLAACDSGQEPPAQNGAPVTTVPANDSGAVPVPSGGGADAGVVSNPGTGGTGSDAAASPVANPTPMNPATPRDAGPAAPAADSGMKDSGTTPDAGPPAASLPKFSFFVTSLNAMRTLSKSANGFGGDLRFGEQGEGAGLRGADKICAGAAEMSMPGATAKQWRAFLSTTTVHARSRIGNGPWYDRKGRLIAQDLASLLQDRPGGTEPPIRDDLPNELGEANQAGSAENGNDDNHDTVTATNAMGEYDGSNTCADWTSTTAMGMPDPLSELLGIGMNGPTVGHSWPAFSGTNWIQTHRAPGCSPSVALIQTGPGSGTGIGNGGGYGGIYCFALTP